MSVPHDQGAPSGAAAAEATESSLAPPSIVDWMRTARRMRLVLSTLGALVVIGWLGLGLVTDAGFRPRLLAELAGIAVLLAFLAEIVVVGGAALRGMLRAGERGDRLAGDDVSLLPPQLRRRR